MPSVFQVQATDGNNPLPKLDRTEAARALAILADPAAGIQLQAIPFGHHVTVAGHAVDQFSTAIDRVAHGNWIYVILNPVAIGLTHCATAEDITRRRWLMVDCDADREDTGVMATAEEHERARRLAEDVMDYLAGLDWAVPVMIDSGNGYHQLYRIDRKSVV